MITTITNTTGRAGIRVYWGYLIILSGDDWNNTTQQIYIYSILFDGRPPLDEDAHNNQPKTRGNKGG